MPDVSGIEDDLRALAEDFGQGRITRAEWLAARGPLEADSTPPRGHRGDRPSPVPVNLRESWPTLSVDRQRAILAAVFGAVLIHPSAAAAAPPPWSRGSGALTSTESKCVGGRECLSIVPNVAAASSNNAPDGRNRRSNPPLHGQIDGPEGSVRVLCGPQGVLKITATRLA